jgi:hypothetical protein
MSPTEGANPSGFQALSRAASGFVPGWSPSRGTPGGAVEALLRVAGRYHDVLAEAVRRAGAKARLAHLDALGDALHPPVPARAVVVFLLDPAGPDGLAPAGTALGAAVPGAPRPVVFETLGPLALAAAPLRDVVLVDPSEARAGAVGGSADGDPIRHALYLGHPTALALVPGGTVRVRVELEAPAERPAGWAWEYSAESGWQPFLPFDGGSTDGTAGLTRSGEVTLVAGPVPAAPRPVHGVLGLGWVRARVEGEAGGPPTAARIARVTFVTDLTPPLWALEARSADAPVTGITLGFGLVDEAGVPLDPPPPGADLQLLVEPLDGAPAPDGPLDPGPTPTPLDVHGRADYRLSLLAPGRDESGQPAPPRPIGTLTLRATEGTAVAILARRQAQPLTPKKCFSDKLPVDSTSTFAPFGESPRPGSAWVFTHDDILARAGARATLFLDVLPDPTTTTTSGAATPAASPTATPADDATATVARPAGPFGSVSEAAALMELGASFLSAARLAGYASATWAVVLTALSRLRLARHPAPRPEARAVAAGPPRNASSEAIGGLPHELCLEARGGDGWSPLLRTEELKAADPDLAEGLKLDRPGIVAVPFTVPEIPNSEWAGQAGRWLRLRLATGGYGVARQVTIPPPANGGPTTLTIVEPRPPRLHAPRIAFAQRTPSTIPAAVLSDNDGDWADHAVGLNQAGQSFAPYRAAADDAPTLYLGFDGPLPVGPIGLDFDLDGSDTATPGAAPDPGLAWEYYDGSAWRALKVADATAGLARSGVVTLDWPGPDEPPAVPLLSAVGTRLSYPPGLVVRKGDGGWMTPRDAYPEGSTLQVRDDDGLEPVTSVVAVADASGWTLATALTVKFARNPRVEPPRLARFGAPRTWVRLRRQGPGLGGLARVDAVRSNAAAVEQVETHRDEVLGGSDGSPRQSFTLRYRPVLEGEQVEVRELSGPRAEAEWDALRAEVTAPGAGGTDDDLRYAYDPQTGRLDEVWVRWSRRPDFLSSGPDDRHYVLDRGLGRITFGDDVRGRIPPAGADGIRARAYRDGGGRAGNVPAGAINQVLAALSVVQAVRNPRRAAGGADGETLGLAPAPVPERGDVSEPGGPVSSPPGAGADRSIDRFLERGVGRVAQGAAAVTPADYEALALGPSAGVAAAACLRVGALPGGGSSAGTRLRLVVLGQEPDPDDPLRPAPELVRIVREAVEARAPAWVAGRIDVAGPAAVRVDVAARVVAQASRAGDPGGLARAAEAALRDRLDPRGPGPSGAGWLSRYDAAVAAPDLARALADVPGVARVLEVRLGSDELTDAERLPVPAGSVPSPRDVRVQVAPDPEAPGGPNP